MNRRQFINAAAIAAASTSELSKAAKAQTTIINPGRATDADPLSLITSDYASSLLSTSNSSQQPGWTVIAGSVHNFSGKSAGKPYAFSVARTKYSGPNVFTLPQGDAFGVLLSVKRGSNTWYDRRIVTDSHLLEYSGPYWTATSDVHLKSFFGGIFGIPGEIASLLQGGVDSVVNASGDFIDEAGNVISGAASFLTTAVKEFIKELAKAIGQDLAKEVWQAIVDAAKAIRDYFIQLVAFGGELSQFLVGNLKQIAGQSATQSYLSAIRANAPDPRLGALNPSPALEAKISGTLVKTIASAPLAAKALATTIIDLP
jgi:hypothetical protein